MIDIVQMVIQSICGVVVGVFCGTILIYALGRFVATMREKMINSDLDRVRKEHNERVRKIQKAYNEKRSQFLTLMGKYRRKLQGMKIINREKVREFYTGDDEDASQTN